MKILNAVRSSARRTLCVGGLGLSLSLFAVACGNGDAQTSPSAASPTPADETTPAGLTLAEAQTMVEELSTATGSYTSPPTTGPEATPGKKVLVVGYGNLSPASIELQEEWVGNIGPALDWDIRYVDGKFDPSVWLTAIRDAINANVDGIVLQFIDCGSVKSGLLGAKEAEIPVMTIGGEDCSDTPLFTAAIGSNYGPADEANSAYGEIQAAWVMADSDGQANILSFENTEAVGTKLWTNSWLSALAGCEGCEIQSESWSFGDLGPALQQQAQQAMLKAADADYVYAQVDDAITGGLAAGIEASGRDVKIVGFDCQPGVIELMEQGKVAVCFNSSNRWAAYSAADGLVRAFAGEEPTSETGRGLRIVTPEVNFPADATTPPEPEIDFRTIYETTWGAR